MLRPRDTREILPSFLLRLRFISIRPTGAPLLRDSNTIETLSCVTHTSLAEAKCSATQLGPVVSTGSTRMLGQAAVTSLTKSLGVRRDVVSTMLLVLWRTMVVNWLSTVSASQSNSLLGPPMRMSVSFFSASGCGLMLFPGTRCAWNQQDLARSYIRPRILLPFPIRAVHWATIWVAGQLLLPQLVR